MSIERRGRPRNPWPGKFGEFISSFTPERLAGELEIDQMRVYRWARGDNQPTIRKAIAVVEIARARGMNLGLEDIYARDFARIRARIQSSLPPL